MLGLLILDDKIAEQCALKVMNSCVLSLAPEASDEPIGWHMRPGVQFSDLSSPCVLSTLAIGSLSDCATITNLNAVQGVALVAIEPC